VELICLLLLISYVSSVLNFLSVSKLNFGSFDYFFKLFANFNGNEDEWSAVLDNSASLTQGSRLISSSAEHTEPS
jgi:hypothetical protein